MLAVEAVPSFLGEYQTVPGCLKGVTPRKDRQLCGKAFRTDGCIGFAPSSRVFCLHGLTLIPKEGRPSAISQSGKTANGLLAQLIASLVESEVPKL